jgi:hypothetical protein
MLFGDAANIYPWHKRGGVYAVRRRSEHLSERPMWHKRGDVYVVQQGGENISERPT